MKKISYLHLLLTGIILFIMSCKPSEELATAEAVDIKKYAGCWYEILRLPNSFEKGLECISATYTIKANGKLEVLNEGWTSEKKHKKIKGTAWIPDPKFSGRLKVRFFWPFRADYYIISVDENYKYALVGTPSRNYLWILSKEKNPSEDTVSGLLKLAEQKGFKTENIIRVNQTCEKK